MAMKYSRAELAALAERGLRPLTSEDVDPEDDPMKTLTGDERRFAALVSTDPFTPSAHRVKLTIDDVGERLPYRNRPYSLEGRSTLHLRERKLILAEVQFLSRNSARSDVVLYAGAAPGRLVQFLLGLFPRKQFELYDTAAFAIEESRRVRLHNEPLTDSVARKWANKNVLFISDFREAKRYDSDSAETAGAMELQERLVGIIRPSASLLKFRLPYEDGPTEYLDGKLFLQAWAPQSSTELRLEVTGNDSVKVYDNREIEERMYYFNTIVREWEHFCQSTLVDVDGIDCCHDCAHEVEIWRGFVKKMRQGALGADAEDEVANLMKELSGFLGRGLYQYPHGLFPDTPMVEKRASIRRIIQKSNIKNIRRAGAP